MGAALERRGWWLLTLVSLAAVWAVAQTPPPNTPNSTPNADTFDVPSGTTIALTLLDPLDTRSTRAGDHALFTVREDIWVGSELAIPRGSSVRATVVRVKRPGRIAGRAEIRVQFDELIFSDGTTLPLSADLVRAGFQDVGRGKKGKVRGEGGKSRDAAAVASGGLQGVILGTAVGGKKGAAYGGIIGASVGLVGVMLERGPDLELPAGTRMDVELAHALAVSHATLERTRAASTPMRQPPSQDLDSGPAPAVADVQRESTGPESTAEPAREPGTDIAHNRTPMPPPPVADDPALNDPDAYRMRVNVQLVLVEAVVREARGASAGSRLEKLTREDFRLFEDGVEQTIRHFSRDELPLAVALVVDTSGSVAPYIHELRRAALEALSQLKREDQVALFVFTDSVERLVDLTTDRARVARRIERLQGEGGTNILDALWEATTYLQLAAPERRRAIILVSDNQATTRPRVTQSQLIRTALEGDTVIYSIKTSGQSVPLTLRLPAWLGGHGSVDKITEETGGEVIDVDRVGSVAAAFGAVVDRLKTRYTLGYHPANKARDGRFRRIEVRLADHFGRPHEDYVVFAKRGYYAPRDSGPADARAVEPPVSRP